MTWIDPATWADRPGLSRVLKAVQPARIVGGAVRDALLGMAVADVDVATPLPPKDVIARLEAAGLKAVPTGLKHGTVTAVAQGTPYEITTLRHDVQTFGRHAKVAFTDDWRHDAARRDFTVNALYADAESGEILDFFGGLEDLAVRRIRFIGDPLTRIAEDHLRILRFFRFSARFAARIDDAGLEACAARANDLMALSRERIRDELLKLLALPAPVETVQVMLERGILAPVLPEIDREGLSRLWALTAAEDAAGVPPHGLRRLAALLPADEALADEIGARLKLSNAERLRLVRAACRERAPADPRALAYTTDADAALDRLLLTGDARAAHWAKGLLSWRKPRMPISGKDLIAMGLSPGPQVSRSLAEVEAQWVEAGFPPEREAAMRLARQMMGVR